MAKKIIYTPSKTNETKLWKKDRVTFLTFPALDPYRDRLVHAYSTRKGGFSKGIYKSMNLGFRNGDSKENVLFNFREFCKAIGIRYKNLTLSNQQHTANIRIATEEDRGNGITRELDPLAIDGYITNEKGVGLCLLSADCVLVSMYDPVREAIALVHSGWKGTAGQISARAVRMLEKEYGTKPEDLIVCLGPSICQECYEVGKEPYLAFQETYEPSEIEEIFAPGKDPDHFQLDLWKAIGISLKKEGVKEDHIHVTDLCTCHNPDLFFSHRYTNGKRGQLAAFLMLLPEPPENPELFKNLLPTFREIVKK